MSGRYYDWLQTIEESYLNEPVMVGDVPFSTPGDAIRYVMKLWPEMEPTKGVIQRDKKTAVEKARDLEPEIRNLKCRMEWCLEELREKQQQAWRAVAAKDSDKSLLGQVEAEVLRDQAREMTGRVLGFSEAVQMVGSRLFELLMMSRGCKWEQCDTPTTAK